MKGKWCYDLSVKDFDKSIGWGKYENQSFRHVLLTDPEYVKWMYDNPNISFSSSLSTLCNVALQQSEIEYRELIIKTMLNHYLQEEKDINKKIVRNEAKQKNAAIIKRRKEKEEKLRQQELVNEKRDI